MAPLAGKPPFATDEPDSFYESSPAPQRRLRQQPAPDPNKRTSAYDLYNNYLDDDKAGNRQSGLGSLGMSLLNMDEDDDQNGYVNRAKPQPDLPPVTPPKRSTSKAAAASSQHSSPPRNIAAPKPGYVISKLNIAHREPASLPQDSRQPPRLQIPSPSVTMPTPISSPSPAMPLAEPHPLQNPVTPICPIFARPAKVAVKFSDSIGSRGASKPIMRSNTEETLLPGRGEKGDDFWRRFSMVVKVEDKTPSTQKESSWLKKTRNGSSQLSRWVWAAAILILLCIGGGIGIGWYLSHKSPDHQQPTAFGGSANETAVSSSSITKTAGKSTSDSSILRIQPTFTVARRDLEATITPLPTNGLDALHRHKKRTHAH